MTVDADGHPVAYKVARGDIIDYVAHRFGFFNSSGEPFEYLNTINQVRRGTYPDAPDSNFALYAGDTLNLSPYTITSIGNTNGKVLNDPPPDPMPPQR